MVEALPCGRQLTRETEAASASLPCTSEVDLHTSACAHGSSSCYALARSDRLDWREPATRKGGRAPCRLGRPIENCFPSDRL